MMRLFEVAFVVKKVKLLRGRSGQMILRHADVLASRRAICKPPAFALCRGHTWTFTSIPRHRLTHKRIHHTSTISRANVGT